MVYMILTFFKVTTKSKCVVFTTIYFDNEDLSMLYYWEPLRLPKEVPAKYNFVL